MKRILYIEDNQDTREAVEIILKNAGFEIKVCASGKEAFKIAEELTFDLFLLDIMLPDMSGWDIFEALKKKNIVAKFVFLSAIPVSFERVQELKNAGISDYITKPFTKSELIIRIKKILEY